MSDAIDLTCREMVELVTDYLEDALPAADRARFELHLGGCEGCGNHLEQMRTTIRVTGTLDEDAFPAGQLDGLIAAFRGWRSG